MAKSRGKCAASPAGQRESMEGAEDVETVSQSAFQVAKS